MGIDQGWPAGKLREFSHERAWAMRHDGRPRTRLVMLCDVDVAGQNNAEAMSGRSDLCQRLAVVIGARHSEPAHTLDLGSIQSGKHLLAARVDNRFCRHPITFLR